MPGFFGTPVQPISVIFFDTTTPPEFIEFANAFIPKPGFLGLVQKINLSIDEQKNKKFCKESIGDAFQAVNKFLSEEEKSHTSLEVWKQLGEAIVRRWILFQSFAYSEWEIRKSIREVFLQPNNALAIQMKGIFETESLRMRLFDTTTPPEFIEFANAFIEKPGFLGLVQKINHSIDEQENEKFCKESIGAAFQAVNKFLSEEEKSHTSLEVWKQLGEAIARRWILFQSFAYSEWEIRKSIREIFLLFSEKKEIDNRVTSS